MREGGFLQGEPLAARRDEFEHGGAFRIREQHLIFFEFGGDAELAQLVADVERGLVIFGRSGDVRFARECARVFARGGGERDGAKTFFEL